MSDLKASLYTMAMFMLALVTAGCAQKQEGGSVNQGVLVATEWLQDHLDDPDLVILHSGTEHLYDSAHIPGARLIIPSEFTVNTEELSNQMPPADSIVELLRRAGVDNDSRIVLYPESGRLLTRTARVFVALDYVGLGDRTFLLNGGLPLWVEEGRETSDATDRFSRGDQDVVQVKDLVIEWTELDEQRWSDELAVIDARTDEEYYGTPASEDEPSEGGHIEAANSLPYQDFLMEDSPCLFKPDSELEELLRKAEAAPGRNTVAYCRSGVRASVIYLVARHLGYPALLYDGSYEEWSELELPLTGPVTLPETSN